MGSRKEEERNEKIIRGLMKLPPNRRCINCNSLGPQYVCTSFWAFVCTTCSGIHREFTHRVKSVSMSKFTSQEVEALQNGGNQCAREIYMRDWDQQRQRLPDSSNADKMREFIKAVYVDKKYAGGKCNEKPPRDLQRLRSNEDETRRASSYHSYSQSPPYDFQYEDRRYGKQAGALTRKPGSDRGLYSGKMSNFICSPTRLSERLFEDRFANEGSVSRVSDVSAESSNFQKEIGYSSPPIHTSRDTLAEDAHQSMDLFPEGFKMPVAPEPDASAAAPIDLFQLPEAPAPPAPAIDFFHTSPADPAPIANAYQTNQTSLDLFGGIGLDQNAPESSTPKNEGWATFDTQPPASTPGTGNLVSSAVPPSAGSSLNFDQVSSHTSMPWPPFQDSHVQQSPSVSDQWNNGLPNFQAPDNTTAQTWNAFGSTTAQFPFEGTNQTSEPQVEKIMPSSTAGQGLELKASKDPNRDQIKKSVPCGADSGLNGLSDIMLEPLNSPSVNPMMEGMQPHATNNKSTNPFDFPYDSDLEPSNAFLDMGSLQATLPNEHFPSNFLDGVNEPWFPQDPVATYVPAAPQGGLAYMAGHTPNPQLGNVQTKGPVASIGGNPFA